MTQTRTLRALLAASSLALAAAAALADGAVDRGAVEAQYQADRQACLAGQTLQASRSTCLVDARLAREAALAGELGGEDPALLAHNRLLRCEAVPADGEDSCLRLMDGEGQVSGSVEEGVILRELVVDLPAAADADMDAGLLLQ